jgi:hypothetical protein
MLVKCGALACIHNKEGMCQAAAIEIVDIEEKENIKFKENDFAVCKTFGWRKD